MITDKHLFSELAYIGPKALVAIKNAICDQFGHEAFEDEEGHPWVGEEVLAQVLITLAAATHLRIAVITQEEARPNDEYVVREEIFTSIGSVCPAKRAELIEKLRGAVSIYATVTKEDETMPKGGAQ